MFLAEENRQLQAKNERQKKKRAKKRSYIATRGVLTVQEGLDLSQIANKGLQSRVATQEATTVSRGSPPPQSERTALAVVAYTASSLS